MLVPLQVDSVVAHASHWGRFDHVMGNINTLFVAQKLSDLPLYIVSHESLVFLLPQVSLLSVRFIEVFTTLSSLHFPGSA